MGDRKHLTAELKFDAQFQSPAISQYRCIVLQWKDNLVKFEEAATTPQGIHVTVKVMPSSSKWLFSAIYGSNCVNDRNRLWSLLEDLALKYKGSWLVARDFNEILKARVLKTDSGTV